MSSSKSNISYELGLVCKCDQIWAPPSKNVNKRAFFDCSRNDSAVSAPQEKLQTRAAYRRKTILPSKFELEFNIWSPSRHSHVGRCSKHRILPLYPSEHRLIDYDKPYNTSQALKMFLLVPNVKKTDDVTTRSQLCDATTNCKKPTKDA